MKNLETEDIYILEEKIKQLEKQLEDEHKEMFLLNSENKKLKKQIASKKDEIEQQIPKMDNDFKEKIFYMDKYFKENLEKKENEIKEKLAELKEKNDAEIKNLQESLKEKESHQPSPPSKNIEILDRKAIRDLEKIEKLGLGKNGKVYKVSNNMICAMKIFNNEISSKDTQKIHDEYELMNSLNHPNIVKTYGIFLSDKTHPSSILYEYCHTNLDEFIKDSTLSNDGIVFIIFQIVEALKFVHSRKVILCNLKPSNILLNDDLIVKISDFGSSVLLASEKGEIKAQKFMAPEILNNEDFDEKVDVYSFGVVLFFILSRGELPNIKIAQVKNGKKAKIPSTFTETARELINKCWNLDPKDRPSFEEIETFLSENNYGLLKLTKAELRDVKSKIKDHKETIPNY